MTWIQPIETVHADCRFRSRLEARWAVFFDNMDIPWLYEPEGFQLSDGSMYLPDFYLPDCSTWVEVKGSDGQLMQGINQLFRAAKELPQAPPQRRPGAKPWEKYEQGPRLLLLGSIPRTPECGGDFAWFELDLCGSGRTEDPWYGWRHTFSGYDKNHRPHWTNEFDMNDISTVPVVEDRMSDKTRQAYIAAKQARFEHGETPRRRAS